MVSEQTTRFEELTRLASDFVTSQRGMWDHTAWLSFLSNVQHKGVEITNDVQTRLGDLLEAMKEYHMAVSSTEDVEDAMSMVFNESVAFIKRQNGVWGHEEWEDFVETMHKNTHTWSVSMEAYLGGVLESLKSFYQLSSAAAPEQRSPSGEPKKSAPVTGPTQVGGDQTT